MKPLHGKFVRFVSHTCDFEGYLRDPDPIYYERLEYFLTITKINLQANYLNWSVGSNSFCVFKESMCYITVLDDDEVIL